MTKMNSSDLEDAKLKGIKEMYQKMSLMELLGEENTIQRAYWRRIPTYFEGLIIETLRKETNKKLK